MTKTISIKKYIRLVLISGIFVFIISFSFFQTKSLNRGAVVSIDTIFDGAIFQDPIVPFSGTAVHATHLSVNDREILVDETSHFSDELVLSSGYNIITVEASDKFKKKKVMTYRVLYEEQPDSENKETAIALPID